MRLLKWLYSFAFALSGIVALDTLILNGKLKLLWIAIANTTSASPFSSDGQSNYILIGIFLIIGLLAYILHVITRNNKDVKNDKDK